MPVIESACRSACHRSGPKTSYWMSPDLGREPTAEELAKEMDITPDKVLVSSSTPGRLRGRRRQAPLRPHRQRAAPGRYSCLLKFYTALLNR
jgi:hypothetical protein